MLFNSIRDQSNIKTSNALNRDPLYEDWEVAQERILLYLKCMHIPPGKDRLILALEALKHANKGEGKVDSVIPAAVRIVRTLVKEYYETFDDTIQTGWFGKQVFEVKPKRIWSMPLLNRGIMVPVEFNQIPVWLNTESSLKKILIQFRPLIVPVFLLLNLLLILGLFLTRRLY